MVCHGQGKCCPSAIQRQILFSPLLSYSSTATDTQKKNVVLPRNLFTENKQAVTPRGAKLTTPSRVHTMNHVTSNPPIEVANPSLGDKDEPIPAVGGSPRAATAYPSHANSGETRRPPHVSDTCRPPPAAYILLLLHPGPHQLDQTGSARAMPCLPTR